MLLSKLCERLEKLRRLGLRRRAETLQALNKLVFAELKLFELTAIFNSEL